MTSASIISIVNRALLACGGRAQVSNLNEGSTESNAASVLFQPCFEALARSADWNCLRQQVTLTLIQAAAGTPENINGTTLPLPPSPWLYAYLSPADCLDARYLVPTLISSTGTVPISAALIGSNQWQQNVEMIPFAVAYSTDASGNPLNVILTNQSAAQLVYTVNQSNPQIWDSLFQEAMVQSLSAYLVPALSLSLPLMQVAIKRAESMIAQARIRDGNEGTVTQDHVPDWIQARNGGSTYNNYNGYTYGYQNMPWPG